MIKDVGNVELFELFDTDPKTQCKASLSYWSEGIVYCTRGHLLKETVACVYAGPSFNSRIRNQERKTSWPQIWETKNIIRSIIWKRDASKRQFKGIHDDVIRERMIQNNRDEDVCRAWDVLAERDHTYRMSEPEYFHYRQNWWIALNKSGNNTQPLRKRSDFNQALSTSNRLHREAGRKQLRPTPNWKYKQWRPASSSSCTWWQWSESWWSS